MALKRSDVDKLPEPARREVLRQMAGKKRTGPAGGLGTLTITLRLPPKELAPNGRVCWQAKARAKREYRAHAKVRAFLVINDPPLWRRCQVKCWFYFAQARRRDPDNLLAWMKAGFDGLTDAGVWADDCGLTHLPPAEDKDRDNPRVEIVVTKEAPDGEAETA